jgi:site-specific DNA recombinase
MKAAIYARVSTERQAERGTIGSQVQALRAHLAAAGDEPAGEYCDDGCSGARLDRPGLDALRDAAEAGLFEVVRCLSPDRLARSYAYQVLILDELARLGVRVAFTDAPGLDPGDPQAKLLTQVQGVIAEYERAKIGERYRRGKLFRARAGEVISWKAPYGYRRVPRGPDGPAHLEIFEPEAAVARRIFADRAAGTTIRQICRQLNADAVPTPTGSRAVWGTSTLDRILRNEAYIGRTYFNRTETVPDLRPGHHSRQVPRPRADWIAIPCPSVIADHTFQAAGKASTDNSKWSPRRAEPGAWLLRGLVKCGPCGVGTSCHKMRGRNGTWHRYYYCHNHDPLRAGGQDRRCPERNIRADALDEFVFGQIRAALLDPALLLAGEHAITAHTPIPDDQLLAAELARLDRKLDAARGEHRRLIDLYQAGLIDMPELQRRAAAITARQHELEHKRASLAGQRADLARGNRLRRNVEGFAARVAAIIDQLDPAQQQKLLRLLIEDVQVTGWHVQIRLRIPLDDPPPGAQPHHPEPQPSPAHPDDTTTHVSTKDRLRSLHVHHRCQLSGRQVDRPVKETTVEEGVDFLVVERDQPGDRQQLAGREVVGPGDVGVARVTEVRGPVAAGGALIGTGGQRVGRGEVGEVDFSAVEVVAGRQPGLEHHHRRARFGQHDAFELDTDAAGGPQRVDARVGVAGVDEDLLVLLEPSVQGIPLEPRPSGQSLDYGVVAVDPQRRGPGHVPDLQAVEAGGAAAELLLVLLIDQHRGVDVG